MNKRGFFPMFFGIVIYLARFIPIFHYKTILLDQWYSINQYSNACETLASVIIKNCDTLKTVNIVLIVLGILLVLFGIFRLIKDNLPVSQAQDQNQE